MSESLDFKCLNLLIENENVKQNKLECLRKMKQHSWD
jgi:hypothetical protein